MHPRSNTPFTTEDSLRPWPSTAATSSRPSTFRALPNSRSGWNASERGWLHTIVKRWRTARAAEQVGDTAEALALWRRVVDAAPLDTAAVLALMRAHDRTGDRAAALLAAREHEQRVRAELDADVDPSVRALEHELRRGRLEREVRPATRGSSHPRPRRTPIPVDATEPPNAPGHGKAVSGGASDTVDVAAAGLVAYVGLGRVRSDRAAVSPLASQYWQ